MKCVSVYSYIYVYVHIFHNSSKETCENQVYLFGDLQTGAPGLHVSPQMLRLSMWIVWAQVTEVHRLPGSSSNWDPEQKWYSRVLEERKKQMHISLSINRESYKFELKVQPAVFVVKFSILVSIV